MKLNKQQIPPAGYKEAVQSGRRGMHMFHKHPFWTYRHEDGRGEHG